MAEPGGQPWWETKRYAVALVLLSMVPLLWPSIPPIIDLPGHMGRYHVSLALHDTPALARFFTYEWRLVGNLGVDLLIMPLAPIFGVELAAKLIVTAIPGLTTAGMLWSAREVHGRLPPTTAFALPLVYAFPFHLGFVNFILAQGLAFLALGLWLYLARIDRLILRALLFAGIGWILWLAHIFGWGMFGLFAFGTELARQRSKGLGFSKAGVAAAMWCLPLALPILVMLSNAGSGHADTGDWFKFDIKAYWLLSVLRDRWIWLDLLTLAILYIVIRRPLRSFAPALLWPALLCFIAFLLLPRILIGAAFVDMRMVPAALMLAILAIMPQQDHARNRRLASAALLFDAVRTVATTASFFLYAQSYDSELQALTAMPRNATVLALANRPCKTEWSSQRLEHLSSMAIVRRDAFVNDQWALDGQQLIGVDYPAAGQYTADPSQIAMPAHCRDFGSDFDTAIKDFNRNAFSFVWTLGFAPNKVHNADLKLVWTNGNSALYRVLQPPK